MTSDNKAIAALVPAEEALPNPLMPDQPKNITVRIVLDGKVFEGVIGSVNEME